LGSLSLGLGVFVITRGIFRRWGVAKRVAAGVLTLVGHQETVFVAYNQINWDQDSF
jgi:hypothetical protein